MAVDGKITIGTKIDQLGAEHGIKDLEKKLKGTSKKAGDIGKKMSTYLTAPFLAMGGMAIKAASDFSGAMRTVESGLGVAKEEAEKLTEVANNIYKKGFGESLDQTAQALVDIKKNFGDLVDEADLEKVTTDALALSKVMDADVNEIARAGTTLMKEFGDSSTEAFDMIAWGAQNGLDFSDEMLDNIAEYGPVFADMGYSTEEYFNLLKQGTEEGAYNLDYINDAMKEFEIRVSDGSDKTADAMMELSDSTQDVFDKFKNGEATVKEVNESVIDDLSKMDEHTANLIGVELYGTKWEDMGSDAVLALGGVDSEIENLDGTMSKITEGQEEAFGQRFSSLLRESMDGLRPVGEILLKLAQEALPPVIEAITKLAEWFSNLSPAQQKIIVGIAALIAAIGPLLMIFSSVSLIVMGLSATFLMWAGIIIGVIAVVAIAAYFIIKYWDEIKAFLIATLDIIVENLTKAWSWIKETTTVVWNAIKEFFIKWWDELLALLLGPIGVLVYLIINNWDTIKENSIKTWNAIKAFFVAFWKALVALVTNNINNFKSNITKAWNFIKNTTMSIWNGIKGFFIAFWNALVSLATTRVNNFKNNIINVWNAIKNATKKVWNGIKGFFTGIWDKLKSGVNGLKDTFIKAWNGIRDGIKKVLNPIIGFMNKLMSGFENILNGISTGINKLPSFSIPSWVPVIGGGKLSLPDMPKVSLPRIPSLDVGTNFVAKDGLAMIHRGEQIVPAEHTGPYKDNQKQPAKVTFILGGTEYTAFVDDITEAQDRKKYRLKRR